MVVEINALTRIDLLAKKEVYTAASKVNLKLLECFTADLMELCDIGLLLEAENAALKARLAEVQDGDAA